MKLMVPCSECMAAIDPSGKTMWTDETVPRQLGEILDGGVVHLGCDAGHTQTLLLSEPLFDLMFEMASLALLEGYYREAVIGISTSLERFYEFCTRAIAYRHGIEDDAFDETWKPMRNQSERQLGAFLTAYHLELKRAFDLKAFDAFTELRNKAAHKGYIPTRDEALSHGETALAAMHGVLKDLFLSPPTYRHHVQIAYNMAEGRRRRLGLEKVSSIGRGTVLNGMGPPETWGTRTFEQGLDELRTTWAKYYAKEIK